ncbi:MAG: hypothetical protein WC977_03970 [Anaerovoracaceae bacterium]|jgi:uncharacterized protein (DUF2267 family)
MAAMQRNNIATRFGRERKAALVRWREIEGLMPGEIAARAAEQWPELPRIHSRTWERWHASAEYRELRRLVVDYEAELSEDRALAAVLNDGRGPEALADLVVMDVVKALRRQTRDEGLTDLRDLASVTRALSPILRRQVDEAKLAADRRLEEAKTAHAAELAEAAAKLADAHDYSAELEAEIEKLNVRLARKDGAVDPVRRSEVIEAVNEFVRGPQTR